MRKKKVPAIDEDQDTMLQRQNFFPYRARKWAVDNERTEIGEKEVLAIAMNTDTPLRQHNYLLHRVSKLKINRERRELKCSRKNSPGY